ncbi:MAG: aspartate kinase [Candidatus Hecatellales archaeon B24]|nr:MAG: aspartate kinase [Candidatus Hecatellales archaeon B24]
MRLVMKFGGSSIASREGFKQACAIVEGHRKKGDLVAVVVSALGDTTDRLVEACDKAAGGDRKSVEAFLNSLQAEHMETCSWIAEEDARRKAEEAISAMIGELKEVLMGVAYIAEITPRVRDYVLSFGERLSAPLFKAALESEGLKSEWFTGKDAGIVTDSNFGNAKPLVELTLHQVKLRVGKPYSEGVIPVVSGFIGADQKGRITTLGRGGSDLTASLLGAALDADEVWLWTDVNGIMTADPKVEPSAKTISQLSYQEAMEMTFFGAKGIHPKAVEVAMDRGLPLRVKNTFNPEGPHTLITREAGVKTGFTAKAVSLIREVALITVGGAGLAGAPEVAAELFQILSEKRTNILMISQGSSEANISFAVSRDPVDELVSLLEMRLLGGKTVRQIDVEEDVCIVALVGAGMKGTPGIAARVFKAVAAEGVNIRMIAQGSSELNISFVVKREDGPKAVKALHREFKLGESS